MNDFNIDRLIGDSLSGKTAGSAFREQLLQESTAALTSAKASRNRLRAAGLTLCVMLIAAGAFICGRMSAPGQVLPEQKGWTNVPADLVAWMDAGRFFEQLGMNERAERAYQQANELFLGNRKEIMRAGIDNNESMTGVLASMPTDNHSRIVVERGRATEGAAAARQALDWSSKNLNPYEIVAQYLGD